VPESVGRPRETMSFATELRGKTYTFETTWGLFSPKGIDAGSRLLIEHIEIGEAERVLDVGCGYGAIGLPLARMMPQGRVDMVDRDFVAVEFASRNARLNGIDNVTSYLSNGLSHVPGEQRFDLIVSNLPAKVGNEMLSLILHDAHARLVPGGRLVVVTINALREHMKRRMRELFGHYEKVKQGKTYTVSLTAR